MDALKQIRTTFRTAFTKCANALEGLLNETKLNLSEIEITYEQLSEKFKQLKDIDQKLLELLLKEQPSQDDYDREYAACEKYEDKHIAFKIKVRNVLKENNAEKSSSSTSMRETVSQYRLPEIQLRQFDGNPREWLNFWTQFEKIHEDARIDERDKYQYLIQSTTPGSSPREIVESFPATAENYKKAVDYLKERYGKESVLIQVYIRDLLQLVISKTKIDLASLHDKLNTRIRSLDSLGLTQDKYADILFPLVESALPIDIVKTWERQRILTTDTEGKTDLQLLMEFVRNEVDSAFRIKIARETFNPEKFSNKKIISNDSELKPFVSTSYELLTANNNKCDNSRQFSYNSSRFKKLNNCIFCEKCHASESCHEVANMTLDLKKDILKGKRACFVCLKQFHRANQCKSGHKCHICQKRHFVILCPDLPSNKEKKNSRMEKMKILKLVH